MNNIIVEDNRQNTQILASSFGERARTEIEHFDEKRTSIAHNLSFESTKIARVANNLRNRFNTVCDAIQAEPFLCAVLMDLHGGNLGVHISRHYVPNVLDWFYCCFLYPALWSPSKNSTEISDCCLDIFRVSALSTTSTNRCASLPDHFQACFNHLGQLLSSPPPQSSSRQCSDHAVILISLLRLKIIGQVLSTLYQFLPLNHTSSVIAVPHALFSNSMVHCITGYRSRYNKCPKDMDQSSFHHILSLLKMKKHFPVGSLPSIATLFRRLSCIFIDYKLNIPRQFTNGVVNCYLAYSSCPVHSESDDSSDGTTNSLSVHHVLSRLLTKDEYPLYEEIHRSDHLYYFSKDPGAELVDPSIFYQSATHKALHARFEKLVGGGYLDVQFGFTPPEHVIAIEGETTTTPIYVDFHPVSIDDNRTTGVWTFENLFSPSWRSLGVKDVNELQTFIPPKSEGTSTTQSKAGTTPRYYRISSLQNKPVFFHMKNQKTLLRGTDSTEYERRTAEMMSFIVNLMDITVILLTEKKYHVPLFRADSIQAFISRIVAGLYSKHTDYSSLIGNAFSFPKISMAIQRHLTRESADRGQSSCHTVSTGDDSCTRDVNDDTDDEVVPEVTHYDCGSQADGTMFTRVDDDDLKCLLLTHQEFMRVFTYVSTTEPLINNRDQMRSGIHSAELHYYNARGQPVQVIETFSDTCHLQSWGCMLGFHEPRINQNRKHMLSQVLRRVWSLRDLRLHSACQSLFETLCREEGLSTSAASPPDLHLDCHQLHDKLFNGEAIHFGTLSSQSYVGGDVAPFPPTLNKPITTENTTPISSSIVPIKIGSDSWKTTFDNIQDSDLPTIPNGTIQFSEKSWSLLISDEFLPKLAAQRVCVELHYNIKEANNGYSAESAVTKIITHGRLPTMDVIRSSRKSALASSEESVSTIQTSPMESSQFITQYNLDVSDRRIPRIGDIIQGHHLLDVYDLAGNRDYKQCTWDTRHTGMLRAVFLAQMYKNDVNGINQIRSCISRGQYDDVSSIRFWIGGSGGNSMPIGAVPGCVARLPEGSAGLPKVQGSHAQSNRNELNSALLSCDERSGVFALFAPFKPSAYDEIESNGCLLSLEEATDYCAQYYQYLGFYRIEYHEYRRETLCSLQEYLAVSSLTTEEKKFCDFRLEKHYKFHLAFVPEMSQPHVCDDDWDIIKIDIDLNRNLKEIRCASGKTNHRIYYPLESPETCTTIGYNLTRALKAQLADSIAEHRNLESAAQVGIVGRLINMSPRTVVFLNCLLSVASAMRAKRLNVVVTPTDGTDPVLTMLPNDGYLPKIMRYCPTPCPNRALDVTTSRILLYVHRYLDHTMVEQGSHGGQFNHFQDAGQLVSRRLYPRIVANTDKLRSIIYFVMLMRLTGRVEIWKSFTDKYPSFEGSLFSCDEDVDAFANFLQATSVGDSSNTQKVTQWISRQFERSLPPECKGQYSGLIAVIRSLWCSLNCPTFRECISRHFSLPLELRWESMNRQINEWLRTSLFGGRATVDDLSFIGQVCTCDLSHVVDGIVGSATGVLLGSGSKSGAEFVLNYLRQNKDTQESVFGDREPLTKKRRLDNVPLLASANTQESTSIGGNLHTLISPTCHKALSAVLSYLRHDATNEIVNMLGFQRHPETHRLTNCVTGQELDEKDCEHMLCKIHIIVSHTLGTSMYSKTKLSSQHCHPTKTPNMHPMEVDYCFDLILSTYQTMKGTQLFQTMLSETAPFLSV